ncbi:MAG: HAMP domain-containing sensor histidine kinase, partial [Bacteroidota bacterium]
FFDSKSISIPLLSPFLALPVVIWILNHYKKYNLSATLGMIGFNIALFLVACSESRDTGVYLHFISSSATSIFLFEYDQRWKAVSFISLSVSLFIIINLVPMDFIAYREYSPENERIFFVLHTIGVTLISCDCLFSVLDQNYHFQKYLRKNQKVIEQKNKDLEKANTELDRFVYSASHDLRAPLASIRGLVSLMEMEKVVSNNDYTSKITSRITVMESYINDIVHYSRNARVEVSPEAVNLHAIVSGIVSSLDHFDNASDLKIGNYIDSKLTLNTDPYRLKVILSNVIANAIKYADLKKDVPFVKISMVRVDTSMELRIEDNGIGIDKMHLHSIFDMFYRASQESYGSGLGLYIAVEAAEKLKYKIEVESEINHGTCFKIKIPFASTSFGTTSGDPLMSSNLASRVSQEVS